MPDTVRSLNVRMQTSCCFQAERSIRCVCKWRVLSSHHISNVLVVCQQGLLHSLYCIRYFEVPNALLHQGYKRWSCESTVLYVPRVHQGYMRWYCALRLQAVVLCSLLYVPRVHQDCKGGASRLQAVVLCVLLYQECIKTTSGGLVQSTEGVSRPRKDFVHRIESFCTPEVSSLHARFQKQFSFEKI